MDAQKGLFADGLDLPKHLKFSDWKSGEIIINLYNVRLPGTETKRNASGRGKVESLEAVTTDKK
jgi:hypothetical protein